MLDFVIVLALAGVWIYCIFDVVVSDASTVRNLPKMAWLLLVIVLGPVGAMAWLFLGRPNEEGAGAWRTAGTSAMSGTLRRASRREAEEDDPAALQERIEARDRLLQQWADEERQRGAGEPPADQP